MITYFGLNSRDHTRELENLLIKRNSTPNTKFDPLMSSDSLGSSISAFTYEYNNIKLLILFDIDDGSGGTPVDCKMKWYSYRDLLSKYEPHDVIVLKAQVNRNPEYNQFYPFKEDVYPVGIFSNHVSKVFEAEKKFPLQNQDIDVFFSGGLKHAKNRPICWPKNRDIRKWWSGSSVRGYKKLLEIKEKRKDLNFALFDNSIPPDQFYNFIRRSKICIDLPGTGLSSRKFYEYMVFGKCVLSLRQQYTPWECEENIHYFSLGEDLDYSLMEEKIDQLLSDSSLRINIENNVKSIQGQLTLDFMVKRLENIIVNKIHTITKRNLHF